MKGVAPLRRYPLWGGYYLSWRDYANPPAEARGKHNREQGTRHGYTPTVFLGERRMAGAARRADRSRASACVLFKRPQR
jgi:hypothetical protein